MGSHCCCLLHNTTGVIYPVESRGRFLGYQLAGVAAIAAWTTAMSIVFFGIMRLFKVHRVPLSVEIMGYDIADHGHLSKRFFEKIRLEQAVEDMILSTKDEKIVKKIMKTDENFLSGKIANSAQDDS